MTFKALLAGRDGQTISTDLVELEEKGLMPGDDLDFKKLAQMTQVVSLAAVPGVARRILDGKIRGRIVVDVNL